LFAKNGYSVALLARGANEVNKIADEINASGGHVS
jgi:NADP-dependent 3-hydroxy acid dehydrogenase YdfG